MPATSTFSLATPTSQPAGAAERVPAAAASLIERVAHTADLVASQPTEKVSVRVELPDLGPVQLSVAMRDGQVQASFHTDSPAVRNALASAWSDFVGGREATAQAWAEPVFAPLTATHSAPGANQEGQARADFGQEGGSRRQEQSPAGTPFSTSPSRSNGLVAEPAAEALPPASATSTTTRLLSATA